MCSSGCLVHMASWRGGVWQQRRQCTGLLFQYRKPSSAVSIGPADFRHVSNSSLPERYVPKLGSEKGAGRDDGGGSEIRGPQPYNTGFRRLQVDRSSGDRGRGDVERESGNRSFPASSRGEKYVSKLIAGREERLVRGFEPRKSWGKKILQQPSGDEDTEYEGVFAPEGGSREAFNLAQIQDTRRKGVESHDLELAAKDYCVALLALGPQPEAKLRMKMSKKKFSLEVMDAAIAELQRCGLQSDQEYAEVFAWCRWNGNAWGPKRIKYELLRRGISKENVEVGLMHVFQNDEGADDVDDEEAGGSKWGMNHKAAEQLLSQARRRWSQGDKTDINARKRRMAGWLQRRGFSWDITSDLLRILQRENQ